jgi:chitodextrinase
LSSAASVTTPAAIDTAPPSTPGNVTATATSATRVDLTWTAATDNVGVVSYDIYRNGTLLTTVGAVTAYSDATVSPSSTYQYQLLARDAAGNISPLSSAVSVTTPAIALVVFRDGFESGNLSAWTTSGGLTVQTAIIHSGIYAAQANTTVGNTYAKKTFASTYNDGYGRLYFNLLSYSSQVNLLRFRTAADGSIAYLYVTTAGKLALRNDVSATSLTSATGVGSGWHALELHVTINGAASTTEVWLDGVKVNDLSITTNLGTAPIGKMQIGEVQNGRIYNLIMDDAVFDIKRIGL